MADVKKTESEKVHFHFFRAKTACCLSKNDKIYTFCVIYDAKYYDALSRKLTLKYSAKEN
jgi:hypothetical protein